MKKKTKAAIAAGAGAVILLGGAGSLAFWNDSSTTTEGEISSGELSLDDCENGGTWTDVNQATTISDIEAFRIVPGDTLSYTCVTAINATGDNLSATLTADIGEVTGDADLLAALGNPQVTATANGAPLPSNTTGVQITPTTESQPIVVTVAITFDPATTGTVGQNQSVNLGATTLELTQNANPNPAGNQ